MPKEISHSDYIFEMANLWSNNNPIGSNINMSTTYLKPLKTDYIPDYQRNESMRLSYYANPQMPKEVYSQDTFGVDTKYIMKGLNESLMYKKK